MEFTTAPNFTKHYSPTVSQYFDEALHAPARCAANAANLGDRRAGLHDDCTKKFSGFDPGTSLQTVADTLLGGWQEGVKSIAEAGAGFKLPPLPNVRRRVKHGATGDELDIHAVRNGRLDRAWRSAPRQVTTGPARVHIIVDNTASCREGADTLKWRGVAGLVLAQALQAAGYQVRIDVTTCSHGQQDAHTFGTMDQATLVTVKDYRQPLAIAALAGIIAHPAGFRRIAFAHDVAFCPAIIADHLGWPLPATPERLREWFPHQFGAPHTFIVPNTLLSRAAAQSWLTTTARNILGAP